MKLRVPLVAAVASIICCGSLVDAVRAQESLPAPTVPGDVKGKEGVKAYLLVTAKAVRQAAGDMKTHADAYAALCAKHGNAEKAAAADPDAVAKLILALRDDYRRIDSVGYEYIEGIVAGVPSLAKYDTELDAGVPAKGASPTDPVAPVSITVGTLHIDREGSLNNFLIEPTVFGTNERFCTGSAKLPGLGDEAIRLPNPALVVALANYAVDGYTRMLTDSEAWQPTDKDCFEALAAMTPTLGDYFEEWKESKTQGGDPSGRFVAVSRVSDMRGIMSSTRLIWRGLEATVQPLDKALVQQLSRGYDQIIAFVDDVEDREKKGAMTPEQIDALGSQAKDKTDKVTTQVVEAAKLLKIEVETAQ